MHETQTQTIERALLVGLELTSPRQRFTRSQFPESDCLLELGELARSAGADVVETVIQRLPAPTPGFFIGRGKAEELAGFCRSANINLVVFDEELSPAQTRNLEETLGAKVVDRTGLILDIFSQRAQSREGRLQIELAQLQYLLPHLTHLWAHFSRQQGGIGTRGPGETQLEVDRRRVQERIGRLKRELADVRRNRQVQRKGRRRHQWPIAALVGYTNAGKSTLLNALTGAHAHVEDKLFATLDPLTRRLTLPDPLDKTSARPRRELGRTLVEPLRTGKQSVLLTDTVGFLRKLPHGLIEAFKATLEEVSEADLLIHVVDASHPAVQEQMAAVESVLIELRAHEKPRITALNKIDLLPPERPVLLRLQRDTPRSVPIAATTGEGLDGLTAELSDQLKPMMRLSSLVIPCSEAALLSRVYDAAQVVRQHYENGEVHLLARIPADLYSEVERFEVEGDEQTRMELPG